MMKIPEPENGAAQVLPSVWTGRSLVVRRQECQQHAKTLHVELRHVSAVRWCVGTHQKRHVLSHGSLWTIVSSQFYQPNFYVLLRVSRSTSSESVAVRPVRLKVLLRSTVLYGWDWQESCNRLVETPAARVVFRSIKIIYIEILLFFYVLFRSAPPKKWDCFILRISSQLWLKRITT